MILFIFKLVLQSSIYKEVISDLWKPVFVKRDMGVYMIDIYGDICKQVLKVLGNEKQWGQEGVKC